MTTMFMLSWTVTLYPLDTLTPVVFNEAKKYYIHIPYTTHESVSKPLKVTTIFLMCILHYLYNNEKIILENSPRLLLQFFVVVVCFFVFLNWKFPTWISGGLSITSVVAHPY